VTITIAAYQGLAIINDIHGAILKIKDVCAKAQIADIILFPETFLQGYFDEESMSRKSAIDLTDKKQIQWVNELKNIPSTLILGLNEIKNHRIYNTALIIENGEIIGKARKHTTYPPFDYFSLSEDFPLFQKKGINYGISICCDINEISISHKLAHKGAQIIFCPMWNIISRNHSLLPHMHNRSHLIARAVDNKVWLVCSDVIYKDDDKIGIGASCIIDPLGNIVSCAQPLTENILIYSIPEFSLDRKYVGLDRQRQEKFLKDY
jgi:predicted amidohydrolase